MCGILAAVGPYAKLIIGRVATGLAVVIGVTAVTWLLIHGLRPELFDDSRALPVQLADYLVGVFVHFDFGRSWARGNREAADLLREGVGADLALMAGGLAFGLIGGLAGGVLSATRAGRPSSRLLEAAAMLALCAPVYVVGLQLLLLFGADIGKVGLPIGIPLEYVPFSESPARWAGSLLVPWIVLGLPLAGLSLRLMRASTTEALAADYVRTARAKGLPDATVLRRHVTPAAAAPTISLTGAAIPLMVTNIVLVENVFAVDGAFADLNRSITTGDLPLVLALTTLGAAFIVAANLFVDLALTWLDPRVREAT
jgi:peptide/nickel transport system permease protein